MLTPFDFYEKQEQLPYQNSVYRHHCLIANDYVAGTVLGILIDWFNPKKQHGTPLKVEKHNRLWICVPRKIWWDYIAMTPRQADTAISHLKKMKLIDSKCFGSELGKATHITINWELFLEEFERVTTSEDINPYDDEGQVLKLASADEAKVINKYFNYLKDSEVNHESVNHEIVNHESVIHSKENTVGVVQKPFVSNESVTYRNKKHPESSAEIEFASDSNYINIESTNINIDSNIESNTNTTTKESNIDSNIDSKYILSKRNLKNSRIHTSGTEDEEQSLFKFCWDKARAVTGLKNPLGNFHREVASAKALTKLDADFDEVVDAYGAWCASRMEWAEKMGISVTFGLSKFAERAEFQVQLLRRQKRSIGSVATQLKTSYEHALELGYDE